MVEINTKALIDAHPSLESLMEGDTAFKALVENDPNFRALVATYGAPRKVKDCTELNENDICMETKCYQGYRIVMKCNGNGGCVRYSREECP